MPYCEENGEYTRLKHWEQKLSDVKDYHIDTVVMGGDWAASNRFEYLKKCCDVAYLDRTPGISTTDVKGRLQK
nr:hypothetical protein [uncultured Olegusella sp.]